MGINSTDIEVLEISSANYSLLSSFIGALSEEELSSFRYYNTRGEEVLKNHLFTCLLLKNETAIGYGHLDTENAIVWLGIVVNKNYQGFGYGGILMNILIEKAEFLGVKTIHLSVDKDNSKAISLYKKVGFNVFSQKTEYSILRKKIEGKGKSRLLGVSSLAFNGKTREAIVETAKQNDWMIEFSSSFPPQQDMGKFFVNTDIRRLAHNYFPAPLEPFVLNLASTNSDIRQKSIEHCISGLELSQKSGAPCFSAHAGFCIDPNPSQLGKKLNVNVPIAREKNWKLFIESVRFIVDKALEMKVDFYIENNVTAHFNLRGDRKEVLFCSRPEEMILLCNEIQSTNFGLLLDTAHLKVSAEVLDFDIDNAVEEIMPYVKYIHHSDNNGKRDTNEAIDSEYWFLPWIKKFKNCIQILEVKNLNEHQIQDQLNLIYDAL